MKMNFRTLLIIGVFILTFPFSVSAQTGITNSDVKQTEKGAPQLKPFTGNRYRINPGDVIEISYRYSPEYNQTVNVQPDGFVTLEIVGEVKVGGLTVEEARQSILQNAAKRLKDPEINLLLKEFQKPYFVVSGEVVAPGKFEMNQNMTALQAVLLAGGFKDSAKSSQIMIFRRINSDTAEVKMLNLKGIKKTGDLEKDFALESGDMIFVPRNMITKIERYMKFTSFTDILRPFLF